MAMDETAHASFAFESTLISKRRAGSDPRWKEESFE
jgi:hypothetical protein